MLSKYESQIMSAIYLLCDGQDGCLISPLDILSVLPNGKYFTRESIDQTINNLHSDGYFDLITSERKGEKMYVITLKESSAVFKRQQKQRQRDVAFKIFLAFIGAVATFIFGLILRAIFGN